MGMARQIMDKMPNSTTMNRIVWCILMLFTFTVLVVGATKSNSCARKVARKDIAWSSCPYIGENVGTCIPHDGFAPINGSWLEPYATSTLPTDLEGCNPASCFNAVRCGIPNCTSVPWGSKEYFKAQHHRGGTDPGINTSPALPYSPKTNLANIWIHPMTRLTATKPLNYNADAFKCYPASNGDSYLYPDAGAGSKYCNPDKLSVCNKHIIAHSCLEGHSTVEAKHLAIVIQKYVLCFKQGEANKCFSSKTSRCVRFDVGLMPTYCSPHSRTKAILADKELRAGRWTECSGDVAALVEEYATMVQ